MEVKKGMKFSHRISQKDTEVEIISRTEEISRRISQKGTEVEIISSLRFYLGFDRRTGEISHRLTQIFTDFSVLICVYL